MRIQLASKKYLRLSVLLLFLVVPDFLKGQSNNFHFEYITITEGLPHNTVFCLLQDKFGFMWFGTEDGLVRYDGYDCKIFKQSENDTVGFQGKSIQCLMQDKAGNLWVGTRGNGINVRAISTGNFKNISSQPALKKIANSWIKTINEDKLGRIWIGTIDDGLLVYDSKLNTSVLYNNKNCQLKSNAVSKIIQDKEGIIWVATSGTGVYYFDEKAKDFIALHSGLSNDTDFESFRKTLFVDASGNLWIGTEGSGLYMYNRTTKKIIRYTIQNGLSSNNILGIAENKNGELLLATDGGGLNILNPASSLVSVFTYDRSKKSLNTNALFDVCIDKDENVWVATYNGGVNVYKVHKTWFETFTKLGNSEGELSHRSVLSILKTHDGNIYVGTDGGGLNVFNNKEKSFSVISETPVGYGNIVKTLFEDSEKRLWVGYYNDGLSLLNRSTGKFTHYRASIGDSTSISGNNVWAIADDLNGKIWIGLIGGGLNLFDPQTGVFKKYINNKVDPNSICSNDIMSVFVDRSGLIWIGSANNGLDLFDRNSGNFRHHQHLKEDSNSISANDIRCIFQDSRGNLWIGTESGGLNKLIGDKIFKNYSIKEGLISNAIMGIEEDENGNIWISSFKGISRLDVKSSSILNFDFHHNAYLEANQFNQSASLSDSGKVLYFGGINGLTVVKANEVITFNTKPNVVLTDFKIFNKSVPIGMLPDGRNIIERNLDEVSEIHLTFNNNVFSFEFAALDFTDPLKCEYAYKMDGFDANWRSTTADQRQVTYTNLDPGTYFFKVKGTNNNGIWSNEKRIKIVIAPPFWETWWFKLIVLIVLAAAAFLALSIYTKRRELALKQKVLESEREILTLTNENLVSEQALMKVRNEIMQVEIEAKNTELLTKAVQTAHKNEILISVKEQLDFIRNSSDLEKAFQMLRGLKSSLNMEIEGEKSWEQFIFFFEKANKDFISSLLSKHSNLTQSDLRMCALTRLNMSNKEMASLLNISVNGVEKSRYRLKKHLGLATHDDLGGYLRAL